MGDVLSREYVPHALRTQEDSKYLSLKQTGKRPQGLKDRKGPTRQGKGNSVFQVIRNSLYEGMRTWKFPATTSIQHVPATVHQSLGVTQQ